MRCCKLWEQAKDFGARPFVKTVHRIAAGLERFRLGTVGKKHLVVVQQQVNIGDMLYRMGRDTGALCQVFGRRQNLCLTEIQTDTLTAHQDAVSG